MHDPIFSMTEPAMRDANFRTLMTCSCRDSDYIPKVSNAGAIVMEGGQRLQIMHNGVKVVAGRYAGEWMVDVIRQLKGHHEPQEEALFHEILKLQPANATMIELGGNWSYYSLWFLKGHDGKRKSVVLEPDPVNLATGKANAAANNAAIHFVNACIGDRLISDKPFVCETGKTINIAQTTVQDLLERFDIPLLDILHCDIQGGETEVLASCIPLFKRRQIRFCVVSTHSHHISGDPLTHQRCVKIIESAGGRILAEHDVHESYSGDGLIVAYFGAEEIDWAPPRMSYNRYSTSLFRNPLFDLDEIIPKTSHPAKPVLTRKKTFLRKLWNSLRPA